MTDLLQAHFSSAFEQHIRIGTDGGTALERLTGATNLSRGKIKQAMQKGAVWITQHKHTTRLRRATKTVTTNDVIHLYYDEKVLASKPGTPKLIADKIHYSIWHKPQGMYSQGSRWGDHCSIHRWIEKHHQPQKPAFIVHRLDRAANGLMVIAHSKKMAATFSAMFQARTIKKHYQITVHGQFPATETPITLDANLDGRAALSKAQLRRYDPELKHSILDIQIDTGRKHQIRRHLAGFGFPVVGDALYGQKDENSILQLTACRLIFTCPLTDQPQVYEAQPDFRSTLI